jgi:hypothetical protein
MPRLILKYTTIELENCDICKTGPGAKPTNAFAIFSST